MSILTFPHQKYPILIRWRNHIFFTFEVNLIFSGSRIYNIGLWAWSKNFKFQIFTPLLTEYIKTNLPVKLPVKKAKLFKLLKNHIGETVSKDEIFTSVWGGNSEEATDWALDALIYRLRKHLFIKAHGYIIESHKKVGYALIQT